MRIGLLCTLILFLHHFLAAQGSNLPLGNPSYHVLDRLEIKTGLTPPFHSALKYYTRGDVTRFALAADTLAEDLSARDRWDLQYIFRENNEWLGADETNLPLGRRRDPCCGDSLRLIEAAMRDPRWEESERPILKYLFQTPANFLDVNDRFFHLRLNPILNLRYGQDEFSFNQRGVELRGGVDDRVFFYFQILETQAEMPEYVDRYVRQFRAVPGAGLYKNFSDGFFNVNRGYDFLNSQGYLAFNISPHIGLQGGYGRHFIGNGYRSLLLSDFANNYTYLRLNWKVWKFHYQNLFAELAAETPNFRSGDELVPKKYMAIHHLSYDVFKNFSIGIFESVVFDRSNQFELQYLNPVILYRAVEQAVGSPDNVFIGFDAKANILRRFQLYGQLILDEFVFNELIGDNRGWWANKVGAQAGIKYIDAFGIDHLDLQAEYNVVRPYTYSHGDSTGSYTHYHQSLAHPLGANFRETVLRLQYRPVNRLFIDARLLRMQQGEDRDTLNYGADILLPNRTRVSEFGNELLQGVLSTTTMGLVDVSYMLLHNLWLDVGLTLRREESDEDLRDLTNRFFTVGVRWNVGRTSYEF